MKISTRLSIKFSIITSAIFIVFGTTVYLLSSNHRNQDFRERLRERVVITEKLLLEKESFSPEELEKITNQFLHTLPEETEEVVQVGPGSIPEFKYDYPPSIENELVSTDFFHFEDSERQGAGKIYEIDGKNYLIIVTAVDQDGLQNLIFLRKTLVLLILIGIPLIFIGSFILTREALLPISKKIEKANVIGVSNLHQRLIVYNPDDELGKMAIAFNKLLDRLEASFESQKSFIRNASHEIRNPLTAIMGEAEIAMSRSRTNEEYLSSLKVILGESETLNSTVNNLLQLSKVSSNDGDIRYNTIYFDKFLNEVKDSFDFIIPGNQVVVSVVPGGREEAYTVSGNRSLLKTAIINLLDNACKYSGNKEVDVKLSEEDKWLILSIRDIGIGILNKDIDKIMSPFYRGNNAMKIKGSGIGLSLSSKIIKLHLGELEIQSKIDRGTEVCVRLPLI